MAVIEGHTPTCVQAMVFRYFTNDAGGGNKPFVVYNPNSTDDTRLAQTCSMYVVTEIAQ